MKKAVFLILAVLLAIFGVVNSSRSQLKSYYSGDAINFNGSLYISTTNTDSLEVFKLADNNLKQVAKVRPYDGRLNTYDNFYDSKFIIENGHLYLYAISGFTLYKYEIINGNQLSLVVSQKNTYWEWYNHVDKFGDNLITTSRQGVKIWSADLQVITDYPLVDLENPYNVRAYNNYDILNLQNNYLTVYDRATRSETSRIPVNYKKPSDNHLAYQDENNNLYVVDDYYAKKFNPDGQLVGSFKHLDYPGYDVASSGRNNYLYFSNGIGVVKLNRDNMKLAAYRFTNNLNGPRGWAMGLRAVDVSGDKIVVFNNANILVLDANLNKIAAFQATELSDETSAENLFLNLDHAVGASGAKVVLTGGGYFPNEALNIDFGGTKSTAQADVRGRFTANLTVPGLESKAVDIKVIGASSGLSYSISFRIQ